MKLSSLLAQPSLPLREVRRFCSLFQLPAFSFQLPAKLFQLPAFSFQLPAFSFQLPAFSFQLSAFSFQLPAFSFQLSAFSFQLPAKFFQLSAFSFQLLLLSTALQAQTLKVEVCNLNQEDRTDEPVIIDLNQYASGKTITGGVVTRHIITADRPEQIEEVPSQLSGKQFLFVADVPARSVAYYTVELSETEPQRSYPERTHAHLKLWDRKYRYPQVSQVEFTGKADPLAMYDAIYGHGAMFESELLGFRIYMDNRQSIDLYGKKNRQMELDVVNFYSTPEFRAAGYGTDILYAGATVAAGSFRGIEKGKPCYIDSVGSRRQRIIESGPVRCIVEVQDRDWFYNGKRIQMFQYYTMYAGHRDVQVDIYLEGADDSDSFVTGVQKLEKNKDGFHHLVQGDGALLASWGSNVPDKEGAPDDAYTLGLGLYVPSNYVYDTSADKHNYLAYLRANQDHIRYYISAYSTLQADGKYTQASQWLYWVKKWKERVQSPCAINVVPYNQKK